MSIKRITGIITTEILDGPKGCYAYIEYFDKSAGQNQKILFNKKSLDGIFCMEDFNKGNEVEFDIIEMQNKKLPINLCKKGQFSDRFIDNLSEFAFIYTPKYTSLKNMAQEERWYWGNTQPYYEKRDENGIIMEKVERYPILENYIKNTFTKISRENKIGYSVDGNWAAFNTGLINNYCKEIYALCKRNNKPDAQPWILDDFVVPGEDKGKIFTALFKDYPKRAKYFNDLKDMYLDPEFHVELDMSHLIIENIERLPLKLFFETLRKNTIEQITCDGKTLDEIVYENIQLEEDKKKQLYSDIKDSLESNHEEWDRVAKEIENAFNKALVRCKWNYRTPVPTYFITDDSMSMLLPLCFFNSKQADVALVLSREKSGNYQGQTILTMQMAYEDSRLIARPDSDWLTPINESSSANGINEEADFESYEDDE